MYNRWTNILSCIAKYIINEIQSVTYLKLHTKIRIEIKHRIPLIQFKTIPSLYELANNNKPDKVWSDGDFGPYVYWKSLLLPFSGICGSVCQTFLWVELIIKITVDMNSIFMKLYVT